MKLSRLPAFKSIFLLAVISCLFFVTMPNLLASAEDQIDSALVASKAWVAQIDAGQYDESYAFGCSAMHDKVPQDRWAKVLKALRSPWGPVLSRKQLSHIYKPNGFEGAEGEFMVITYDTSFKQFGPVTEVVVLRWDGDKWRGAGYNAGMKSSPDADSAAPAPSNTETHTDPHAKPLPQ